MDPDPTLRGHVVLAGCDGLAVRMLEDLVAIGQEVVAIARHDDDVLAEAARRAGAGVVVGPADRPDVLRAAGIGRARALALVDEDDVGNLDAALAAQELHPGLRLVVRIYNLGLGRELERLFDDCHVLSAAALAAPVLAHAAGHGAEGVPVTIDGRVLEVRHVRRDDPRLVAALGEARVRTVPDLAAAATSAGEEVVGLVEIPAEEAAARRGRRARDRVRRRVAYLAVALVRSVVSRRLAVFAAATLALAVGAATVWHERLDLSWVEAFYFTATTLTTVGYGDINLLEASDADKLLGALVMALGAVTVGTLLAILTDALVSARIATALGRRPPPQRDHVVVCGLGQVGYRVVAELVRRGFAVVAVERDENGPFVELARQLGVPVVTADAALYETLEPLRLPEARALVAATDDDLANLETALHGRNLDPSLRVVLRLFRPGLAERVGRAFDINISRSVATLAAPSFVAAVLGRRILATIPVGRGALAASEHAATAAIAGRAVGDVERTHGVRVLEAGGTWRPPPGRAIGTGERLVVVAEPAGLASLEAALAA